MIRPPQTLREWMFDGRCVETGTFPLLMGIVNVTPDSFSDGGEFLEPEMAVRHAIALAEAGADILDVGGESTRPGAEPVPPQEELKRVVPVVKALADRLDLPISIDTTKAAVAAEAIAAGASIVNDVSALTMDPEMLEVCAESEVGVIAMHMRGTPRDMQENPTYDDVVGEIRDYLRGRLEVFVAAGIDERRVVLDPGVGFGKTAEHNLLILSQIAAFRDLGRPILIGHSRKRFLGRLLGRPLDERTWGTVGVSVALAEQHTDILRVHDVAAVRDALQAHMAIASRVARTET